MIHWKRLCAVATLAVVLAGCGTDAGTEGYVTDEVSASMGSDEAGAAYALEEDVTALQGDMAKSVPAAKSITAETTVSPLSITYYDAGGSVTTDTSAASYATLTWSRESSFSSARASGTSTVESSLTVSGLAESTWTVTGTMTIARSTDTTSGRISVDSSLTHTLDLTVNKTPSPCLIAGGSATTEATVDVNGRSFDRGYTWSFNGGGSATLTGRNGTTVSVTVTVESGS